MSNHEVKIASLILLGAVLFLAAPAHAQTQTKKTSAGGDFFIVASIDLAKSQILLKEPTEVTRLLNLSGTTEVVDASGKSVPPSDLRAGDTVWVVSSGQGQSATAIRIRKGPMSVADLHRLYLDYPEIQ